MVSSSRGGARSPVDGYAADPKNLATDSCALAFVVRAGIDGRLVASLVDEDDGLVLAVVHLVDRVVGVDEREVGLVPGIVDLVHKFVGVEVG
jgi:hypothetical protein